MDPLATLENGDMDVLRGSVVVYSRCAAESAFEPDQFEAMFFSAHPAEFSKKMGLPAPKPKDDQRLWIYGTSLTVDQNYLLSITDDVVYAGRYTNVEDCVAANHMAANLYMLHYKSQLSTGVLIGEQSYQLQLQARFLAPLLEALDQGDAKLASQVAQGLTRFCGEGGPLSSDAKAIAMILTGPVDGGVVRLIRRYVDKMLAIVSERFEEAAKIRDEIALMRST